MTMMYKNNQLSKKQLSDYFLQFKTTLSLGKLSTAPKQLSPKKIAPYFFGFNEHFEKLKEDNAKNPPNLNLLQPFGIDKDEVRNCRLLAWFLNPISEHMQGNRFFTCFLDSLPNDCLSKKFSKEKIIVRRELWADSSNRIDINITGQSFILGIEAKIKADLRDGQLSQYWQLIKSKAKATNKKPYGLFLTISGEESSDCLNFRPMSWKNVCHALKKFASPEKNGQRLAAKSSRVQYIASQYADHIETFY